jgi:hypothetical protein
VKAEIGILAVAAPFGGVPQNREKLGDFVQLSPAAAGGGKGGGGGLDRQAEFVAALQVGDRLDRLEGQGLRLSRGGNIAARSLTRDHQPLGPQPFQGGTDDRPRNLELAGKVIFPRQPRAVGILAVRDRPADAVVDDVGKQHRTRRRCRPRL